MDAYPSCNPAGTTIAWAREISYQGVTQIYRISVDDFVDSQSDADALLDAVKLTNTTHESDATMPAWSPSGSQIAYATDQPLNASTDYEIWIMNSDDGSAKTPLTDNSDEDDEPNWGPAVLE